MNDPFIFENETKTIDITGDCEFDKDTDTDPDILAWNTQFIPKAFQILATDYIEVNENTDISNVDHIANHIKLSEEQTDDIKYLIKAKLTSVLLTASLDFELGPKLFGKIQKQEKKGQLIAGIKHIDEILQRIEKRINYSNKHTIALIENLSPSLIEKSHNETEMLYHQKMDEINLHLIENAFISKIESKIPLPVRLILTGAIG